MPSPIPGPPPFASATLSGLVSTTIQQFAGDKEFLGKIQATGNPVGLGVFTTGTLPAAASHPGAILYNTTVAKIQFSNGAVWASLDAGAGSFVQTTGDTMTGQLNIVGAGIAVDTADNTFVVDATNNRVGIRTAAPGFPLDVKGDDTVALLESADTVGTTSTLIVRNSGGTDGLPSILFQAEGTTVVGRIVGRNSAQAELVKGLTLTVPSTYGFGFSVGSSIVGGFESTGNFFVDTNTFVVDAVNNRVGIGTATPSFPLSVNGIVQSVTGGFRFPDATTQTTAFVPTSYVAKVGDTMSGQLTITGAGLVVDSADNTLVVDATNNRVAIGHATPGRVLDIRSTHAADYLARFQNNDVTGASALTFHNNADTERFRLGYANPSFATAAIAGLNFLQTDATDLVIAHATTQAHRFYAGSSNIAFDVADNTLYIDSANNRIGILTASPSASHVVHINQTQASNGHTVRIHNNSNAGYGDIEFYHTNGSTLVGSIGYGGSGVTQGGANDFHINYTNSNGLRLRAGVTDQHYFNFNGNVTFDTTDNGFHMDAVNNRIGIYTGSPSGGVAGYTHPLHINLGTTGTRSVLISGGGTISKGLSFQDATNNRTWTVDHRPTGENNRFEGWYHNGTTAVRQFCFTTTGRLGVGDVTPVVELDVIGSGQFTGGLTVDTDTLSVNAADNNVGIGGTALAANKLQVFGKTAIGGDLEVDTDVLYASATNNRVGINNATPTLPLHLVNHGESGAAFLDTYSGGAGTSTVNLTSLHFRAARDTAGSPDPVQTNDHLGAVTGRGYGSTGFATQSRASVVFRAAQNWTDANQGSYIEIFTTPNNSTTLTSRMRIENNGDVAINTNTLYVDAVNGRVGIGDATPSEALEVVGNILASGTITGSNLSGTNTGNVTLAAVGSSPNASAATLTGQALNLEPASDSFPGVVTTGAQTFGGMKTFAAVRVTAATGTGITTDYNGDHRRGYYKVTFTEAAFTAAALTEDLTVCTIPAKARVVSVIADTTTAFTGGGAAVATLRLGKTVNGQEYILDHSVFTTGTKGLVDADLGTSINRANAVQGGDIPSWTASTDLKIRLTSDVNVNTLTTGSITFYITVEFI